LKKDRGQTYFEPPACLVRGALAGRKPVAMRVHDGDKNLFPLSTPCIVNRRPLPNANFQLLPCARQFIASFPIFFTRRLQPLVSIISPLLVSIASPPPAFAGTCHVWVWVGRTPRGEASASDSEKAHC
jgi:hypothetical protein